MAARSRSVTQMSRPKGRRRVKTWGGLGAITTENPSIHERLVSAAADDMKPDQRRTRERQHVRGPADGVWSRQRLGYENVHSSG